MSSSSITREQWSVRVAEALVSEGYLDRENAVAAVEESNASGRPISEILEMRGLVPANTSLAMLGRLTSLQFIDLDSDGPTPEAFAALPLSLANEYKAIGHRISGEQIEVVFGDPPDGDDLRTLSALIGMVVTPVLADPTRVERLIQAGEERDSASASNGTAGPEVQYLTGAPDPSGEQDTPLHIDDLLRYAVGVNASDLHLTTGMPACIRLHGAVRPIDGCPVLSNDNIREMIFGILPQSMRERFEEQKELDTSHSIAGVGRFRVNVFLQRGTVAAVLRSIPHEVPPFEDLGIPESVKTLTELRRGLVLVTGPTGSGKSTTLASMVDAINKTKPLHIITIEDPIEFLHNHKRSIVNQREVGQDTNSFAEALRRVLREDPDVILVGEMRDLETISMALTAAETGHLVFGTLHTQDAPQTIDRIIDVFPVNQQQQVRTMLSAALEGVVTQQLILNAEGTGRLPCCEVMICTSAVRNLIRSSKSHQIYSHMQTGAQYGMQTMDQGLARLVQSGKITEGVAFDRCRSEEDLRNHLAS